MTRGIRELRRGMKAFVTKAFIPRLNSLIPLVMRGRMEEMKCGVEFWRATGPQPNYTFAQWGPRFLIGTNMLL